MTELLERGIRNSDARLGDCSCCRRDALPRAAGIRHLRRLRRDQHGRQRDLECRFRVHQGDAILRTPRSREARLDGVEHEFDGTGVHRIRCALDAEQPLRARIRLDELDVRFIAAREPQVIERHLVDGEDRDRRAVLRTHVAERRAVGNRQVLQPFAEELDELADDPLLAEQLRDRQHQVGRRGAPRQRAGQTHAEHLRNQHRAGLPQHRRFRFDAAHAPPHDAQTVDHRRV